MFKLDTLADLDSLITNQVRENSEIEYKATPAVDSTDKCRVEIAKDVSAMANANGGQIVYGMTEDDHLPKELDGGIDPKRFNGLWFEQVIQQNVSPGIENLKIKEISLANGNIAVVVTVPASEGRGAHQLRKEGRYYRRRNFRNDIMEDYEVRELMNRTVNPLLVADFHFDKMSRWHDLDFSNRAEESQTLGLTLSISNLSNQPAMYAVAIVFLDQRLILHDTGPYERAGTSTNKDRIIQNAMRIKLSADRYFPIFKEMPIMIPAFGFRVHSRNMIGTDKFAIAYELRAPGCFKYETGHLELRGTRLIVRMPSHMQPSGPQTPNV